MTETEQNQPGSPDRPKYIMVGGPDGWPELPNNPFEEPWPGAWPH